MTKGRYTLCAVLIFIVCNCFVSVLGFESKAAAFGNATSVSMKATLTIMNEPFPESYDVASFEKWRQSIESRYVIDQTLAQEQATATERDRFLNQATSVYNRQLYSLHKRYKKYAAQIN